MSELSAIDKWLYSTLTAGTALHALVADRIYDTLAPQTATMPYVIFQSQAPRDVNGIGAYRIMVNALYLVKAVSQATSFATPNSVASAVDTLLHKTSGSNSDGSIFSCVREEPFKMIEPGPEGGVEYRWAGGLYRIQAQKA